MKFNFPIQIDFFEWLKHGTFDCLKFGQTKEWILHNFPDPDAYGVSVPGNLSGRDAWMHPYCNIWSYGDLELFFYEDNTLYMIFCDDFMWQYEGKWHSHEIKGGDSLMLNKWFFQPVRKLSLPFVMENLLANGIYFVTQPTKTGAIELTIQKTGFSFHFEPLEGAEQNIRQYRCCAFWMIDKPLSP